MPRPYTHSLRNMEPLLPLLLNIWNGLCAKITHPFITKYGTPLAPITKYGTAYVPRSHTHSLRNMEALMTPSQNAETLMSWTCITKWVTLKCKLLFYKNRKPLFPNNHIITTSNSYFESWKWYKRGSFHYWKSLLSACRSVIISSNILKARV